MLLAFSGYRSGVVLNILQSIGQPLTTKNRLAPDVHSSEIETA